MTEPSGRATRDDGTTPPWFSDAKLGIFVHWGAYAVPAWAVPLGELGAVDPDEFHVSAPYAEWYANTIRIPDSPAARHHAETYGGAPYDAFLDEWRAERFDAAGWAGLFAGAGARYVVLTTKHHDGICLWDAPGTGTRNTVHRGPRRDIVGEVATAVRGAGMRFGAYYSGGLDWYRGDFPPISRDGDLDTYRPLDDGYARYAHAHVEDLIDRYAPDVLWNDINWPDAGKDRLIDLFHHYHGVVPDGVVNDRWNIDRCDYLTSEYSANRDRETAGRPWERCRGIGYSFGYNRNETAEHCLTGPALVRQLVDVVVHGGNLLLNVGPRADGTISDLQRRPLAELGAWLAVNGEAIFGTRPWPATAPAGCAGLTATGTHVYAHFDGAEPAVVLPLSTADAGDRPAVSLLGHGPVPARWSPGGLHCELPHPAGDLPGALRIGRASKGRDT
ncbi:MAG TPA: alpha-L-fucosidase [Rugosimonospora sp.]